MKAGGSVMAGATMTPAPAVGTNGARPWDGFSHDMAEVERILREESCSGVSLAEEVCRYVHEAGGKRLRPALVILSCRALGSDSPEPWYAGAAVEMIHAATLLHDDVVDHAQSRRGRVTVSARWGDGPAVIAGNLLFSRAFGMLARRERVEELRVLSNCMMTMCRGEIMQNVHRGNLEMTEATYTNVIRAKTADFLAACCRIGAMLAGADSRTMERMAAYGMNLGLAFQVTDDLLDVCGDEREIGKPVGGDLREGKMTLPLILGLQSATPAEREQVRAIARQPAITPEEFERVRGVLLRYHAPERTRRVAEAYTQASLDQLDPLPESPARAALAALAESLSTRSK
ncbi:MAG: polyprenyl synthetase family protein [Armatimonadetes bacterium]|nr:polyprenyl synthetase family protein [Armatimonadota bacterium]